MIANVRMTPHASTAPVQKTILQSVGENPRISAQGIDPWFVVSQSQCVGYCRRNSLHIFPLQRVYLQADDIASV